MTLAHGHKSLPLRCRCSATRFCSGQTMTSHQARLLEFVLVSRSLLELPALITCETAPSSQQVPRTPQRTLLGSMHQRHYKSSPGLVVRDQCVLQRLQLFIPSPNPRCQQAFSTPRTRFQPATVLFSNDDSAQYYLRIGQQLALRHSMKTFNIATNRGRGEALMLEAWVRSRRRLTMREQ